MKALWKLLQTGGQRWMLLIPVALVLLLALLLYLQRWHNVLNPGYTVF